MKSIFISYVYEDKKYLKKLLKWEEKGYMGDYTFTYETEDLRDKGKKAIKNHLKNKIKGCTVVLVLIGDNTHNHDWITAEVELANSFHKKIVCMRIPNTTGNKPPVLKNKEELVFNPNQIIKHLKINSGNTLSI